MDTCPHGRKLKLRVGQAEVECAICQRNIASNNQKLGLALKGVNGEMVKFLWDLIILAFFQQTNPSGALCLEGLRDTEIYKKDPDDAEHFLTVLPDFNNPRLLLYDRATDCCLLFNPLADKQCWVWPKKKKAEKPPPNPADKDEGLKCLSLIPPNCRQAKLIPAEAIKPFGEGQIRSDSSTGFNPERQQLLVDSLKAHGQTAPGILAELPEPEGPIKYQLLVGERRWRAAQTAGIGKFLALVLPKDTPRETLVKIMAVENSNRVEITTMENAREAKSRLMGSLGMNLAQAAEVLGLKPRELWTILPLCDLHLEVQNLLISHSNILSVAQAKLLIKYQVPTAEQPEAAKAWIQYKLASKNKKRGGRLVIKNILDFVPSRQQIEVGSAEAAEGLKSKISKQLSVIPRLAETLRLALANPQDYETVCEESQPARLRRLIRDLRSLGDRSERLADMTEEILEKLS